MSWFRTIRSRYTLVFSCLSLVFLAVVAASFLLISFIQSSVGRYADGASLIQNADRDLYQSRLALTNLLTNTTADAVQRASWRADTESNASQALQRMQTFQKLTVELDEIVTYLEPFSGLYQQWQKDTQLLLSRDTSSAEDIQQSLAQSEQVFSQLRELYDGSEALISKYAAAERKQIDQLAARFKLVVTVIATLVVLGSLLMAWIAPRRISDAIRTVTVDVEQISSGDGDLSRRINSKRLDETGDLSRALDEFIAKLGSLIGEVKRGCLSVQTQMQQMGVTAEQASQLSLQQDQALDMIVTAIEEMSGATKDVAHNAAETAHQVHQLSETSNQGQHALAKSTERLHQLSQQVQHAAVVVGDLANQSEQIASVTGVIQTIAEQTNLLALNAAIEAARAGDQGRGFAVVADEVRALASKTQQSTEHIRQMIQQLQSGVADVVSSIQQGVTLADNTEQLNTQVGMAFHSVQQSAGLIEDHALQTASATEQQSMVAHEITKNLSHLSDMSKQLNQIAQRIQLTVRDTLGSSDELAGRVKRFSV
ncbi:methyl-accepting chemotaxis protein [Rheinheimera sediminis]|uniref:methyl-accepting chemotaxis protein n=1 Tax=Rheinheimera sp. YQF-1 TaxID=2499626 RepID=UPI000FDA87F1|nr:methyl-accepting chemotaxis protein [Rheinheimera sp. YQF-1]RVT46012.1 methyl-accepting chemotaxis protein [Rheinheimera sp. YQF-1]